MAVGTFRRGCQVPRSRSPSPSRSRPTVTLTAHPHDPVPPRARDTDLPLSSTVVGGRERDRGLAATRARAWPIRAVARTSAMIAPCGPGQPDASAAWSRGSAAGRQTCEASSPEVLGPQARESLGAGAWSCAVGVTVGRDRDRDGDRDRRAVPDRACGELLAAMGDEGGGTGGIVHGSRGSHKGFLRDGRNVIGVSRRTTPSGRAAPRVCTRGRRASQPCGRTGPATTTRGARAGAGTCRPDHAGRSSNRSSCRSLDVAHRALSWARRRPWAG
jgi:hypothetical protein